MFDPLILLGFGSVVIVSGAVGSLALGCFKKCGPNQAMIVSGLGAMSGQNSFTIVKGGGMVVFPVIQQYSFLSLEIKAVDVGSIAPITTKNGIPLNVAGVAQVKVGGDAESIALAAEHFLDRADSEIKGVVQEIFLGHLRTAVGALSAEELCANADKFTQQVQNASEGDLRKMGMTCVLLTIKEIKDNVGYIDALNVQLTADARKKAAEIMAANT